MSNSKKYKSIYGSENLLTAAQYLAELIAKRRSKKKGLSLPDRFWSNNGTEYKYWKNVIVSENIHANKLLKKYDEDCVIKAFNSYECEKILSIKNKKLEEESRKNQKIKNDREKYKERNEKRDLDENKVPSKPMKKKKSKLGKLK